MSPRPTLLLAVVAVTLSLSPLWVCVLIAFSRGRA